MEYRVNKLYKLMEHVLIIKDLLLIKQDNKQV